MGESDAQVRDCFHRALTPGTALAFQLGAAERKLARSVCFALTRARVQDGIPCDLSPQKQLDVEQEVCFCITS